MPLVQLTSLAEDRARRKAAKRQRMLDTKTWTIREFARLLGIPPRVLRRKFGPSRNFIHENEAEALIAHYRAEQGK